MSKSDDCVNNEHGSCKGIMKEVDLIKICACPCHDTMYQLVRNTMALVNQAERTNPFSQNYDERL